MSTHRLPAIALALGLASSAAFSAGPNLGIPLEPADIAAWDISIMPDGKSLPIGGGTPAQRAKNFAQKSAPCPGDHSKGGDFSATLGGGPLLVGVDILMTNTLYWAFSSPLFD